MMPLWFLLLDVASSSRGDGGGPGTPIAASARQTSGSPSAGGARQTSGTPTGGY